MSIDKSAPALDALYREVILDHHRHPRNFSPLPEADAKVEEFNPLCGDRVEISALTNNGKILACHFQGEGCSICMSSASMMTEEMTGRSLEEAQLMVDSFRALMKGEKCPLAVEGDLEALVGVRQFPVRIKCAVLPWTTMEEVLREIRKKKGATK